MPYAVNKSIQTSDEKCLKESVSYGGCAALPSLFNMQILINYSNNIFLPTQLQVFSYTAVLSGEERCVAKLRLAA